MNRELPDVQLGGGNLPLPPLPDHRNRGGRPRVLIKPEEVSRLRDQERLSWRQIAKRLRRGVGTVRRAYSAASDGSK